MKKGVIISVIIIIITILIYFLFIQSKTEIDFYSCTTNEDCIKVKGDCCGCGGGGNATAINKQYETEWEQKLTDECGENVICPAVMSNDPFCFGQPLCGDGKCGLVG